MNKLNLSDYFNQITHFPPYSFQLDIAKKALSGNSVIMQAPTGSGKTWASIVPFLIARKENMEFPQKLIYALPLRVLANSLYSDIKNNEFIKQNNIKVTIQTGEKNDDPYFIEGDIIFTTIDQVLSSLLCIPFSVSKRQGNINAGAILSSYLVFDEFHLLDYERSLSTVFTVLKEFKGKILFCLMTATLSENLLNEMCNELNVDRVIVDREKFNEIKSQRNKIKRLNVVARPISSDDVLKNHKKLSIVLCNTVERAQHLYLDLRKRKEECNQFKNTKLICINSRFTSRDRNELESDIKNLFKKNSNENAILISTQIIEVGIDISCDTMHTEISPINSFLQRIGRCARYDGEEGRVFVYDVEKEKNKQPYLPYNKELCIDTFNELMKVSGENLDYFKNQELIDKVLSEIELRMLMSIVSSDRYREIKKCWLDPQINFASSLIREVNAVSVIVCRDYHEINNIKDPYRLDTISIFRPSLSNKLSKIEKVFEDDWIVGIIEEDNMMFDWSDEKRYKVEILGRDDNRLFYEPLLILNSKYVSYSREVGLNFENIGGERIDTIDKKNNDKDMEMSKETYREHIERMLLAYSDIFQGKYDYVLKKSKIKDIEKIDELIKFMIIMHDFGKLSVSWQCFAIEWQKQLGDDCSNQILAHTDMNKDIISNKKSPPPHSGAGAIVSSRILEDALPYSKTVDKIITAIITSILRHHGVTVNKSYKYETVGNGKEEILYLLNIYCQTLSLEIDINEKALNGYDCENLSDYICDFSKSDEILLYFIFVRILRICDQKSFDYK